MTLPYKVIRWSHDVDYDSVKFPQPRRTYLELRISWCLTDNEILVFDNKGQMILKMKVNRVCYNVRDSFFESLDPQTYNSRKNQVSITYSSRDTLGV